MLSPIKYIRKCCIVQHSFNRSRWNFRYTFFRAMSSTICEWLQNMLSVTVIATGTRYFQMATSKKKYAHLKIKKTVRTIHVSRKTAVICTHKERQTKLGVNRWNFTIQRQDTHRLSSIENRLKAGREVGSTFGNLHESGSKISWWIDKTLLSNWYNAAGVLDFLPLKALL